MGKTYVEPDFVIRYGWNDTYKLVELERPEQGIATKVGHPKVHVTHAGFQVAEWRHYINTHYSEIQDRYPGIAGNPEAMIVISRNSEDSFATVKDRNSYLSMLRLQQQADVLTYDDLLQKARMAQVQLAQLRDS